jgi:hypothetical protein
MSRTRPAVKPRLPAPMNAILVMQSPYKTRESWLLQFASLN